MTIAVIKEGPYYVTEGTPISFSSLRTNFKGMNSEAVSASQLRRDTSTESTDPTVPNATENENISTSLNLKLSQFRNSIKRYTIRQSSVGEESAETNFDIDAQNWNSNLGKNIQKTFEVTGVIGATSTANAAATFNATAYNLKIDVHGWILGKGGAAGTPNGGNGGNGGPALSVTNQVQKAITIRVLGAGAKIYGGGGGGGAGNKGGDGSLGTAGTIPGGTTTTYGPSICNNEAFAGGNPVCEVGSGHELVSSTFVSEISVSGIPFFVWECCRRSVSTVANPDIVTAGGTAGTGGPGGAGGQGQGYDTARSDGVGGSSSWVGSGGGAGGGGTATAGTDGSTGITGGNGGVYGVDGTAANPGGNGGTAGRAIAGSNYVVTENISGDTVKGLYNP